MKWNDLDVDRLWKTCEKATARYQEAEQSKPPDRTLHIKLTELEELFNIEMTHNGSFNNELS